MSNFESEYYKTSRPDVINISQAMCHDARLQNVLIMCEGRMRGKENIHETIEDLERIQKIINERLYLILIEGKIDDRVIGNLKEGLRIVDVVKSQLQQQFKTAIQQETTLSLPINNAAVLTMSRLLFLAKTADVPYTLETYSLGESGDSTYYYLPTKKEGLVAEAIGDISNREDIVGFTIKEATQEITLLFEKDKEISQICLPIDEVDKKAIETRIKKNVIVAVEGDIAGHAIRAHQTAKGLRNLGYNPAILGRGYYMTPFIQEGFQLLESQKPQQKGISERERIIQKARGEGKGGIFFWDYATVRERAEEYKNILQTYLKDRGIDLFISDMSVLADLAATELQQSFSFPSITETHDITLSPRRVLRSLKLKGIPVGKVLHAVQSSSLAETLDPKGWRYIATHALFNDFADILMGLPLTVYDHTHRKKDGKYRKKAGKFTHYLYGRDGTIFFGTNQSEEMSHFPVGLQTDKGTGNKDEISWLPDVPETSPFILNTQGSTYNKDAWNIILKGVHELPGVFSVHGTGKKEDQPHTYEGEKAKGITEPPTLIVGYAPGYALSKKADLVIHHGGHGTISQWLLATCERIESEKHILERYLRDDETTQTIRHYVRTRPGTARSIAICNTFEQENNALAIRELGGDSVCKVITADDLTTNANPSALIQQMVTEQLTRSIDTQEKKFWISMLQNASQMNSSIHAAMIIERIVTQNEK